MDADKPIDESGKDRLGFTAIAEHLATAIIDEPHPEGLVFGVEGKWGSGKSSLLKLTMAELQKYTPVPKVIEFSPWLVGDRDALLSYLFAEIESVVSMIEPAEQAEEQPPRAKRGWAYFGRARKAQTSHQKFTTRKSRHSRAMAALKRFKALSIGASKVAKIAELTGIPFAGTVSSGLEKAGDLVKISDGLSLSSAKRELQEALRDIPNKIVVFIDDLDRLDPGEVYEVLRLVRAVADLPNIIYVLSYDPHVVSKIIESAIRVESGSAFLEKIVQVSFRVPVPEAFDLRRWLENELTYIINENSNYQGIWKVSPSGISEIIDLWGGILIKTPRDVVRTINFFRLHAVPVIRKVDVADLVWLQIIRVGLPVLEAWVAEYMTEVAAIYGGASVSVGDARRMARRLDKVFEDRDLDAPKWRMELRDIIPGAYRSGYREDSHENIVYNELSEGIMERFINNRRMGSPDHYKYYFAFTNPSGSLTDDQVEDFVRDCSQDISSAVSKFDNMARQRRQQGGVMAEILVDRLNSISRRIPQGAIAGILLSLSNSMDEVARQGRGGDFGRPRAWRPAERLSKGLLRVAIPTERPVLVEKIFRDGRALGWLSLLLRSEIFAHGHYGDRQEPQGARMLTGDEFASALNIMIERYKTTEPAVILEVPSLNELLFAWLQGAKDDTASNWVSENSISDEQLLDLLEKMRTWMSSSSEGIRYPLQRGNLEPFMDYEKVRSRVSGISASKDLPPTIRNKAFGIEAAFRIGEE